MSNFYDKIIKYYSRVSFPRQYMEVCRLDGPISWYFADSTKQIVAANGVPENRVLMEIDIKSAYPTICNNLLNDIYPEFIQQMNQIEEKKPRNIFIATTLRDTIHLKRINHICKLIILGYIFDQKHNEDILLLELKKDGCILLTNDDAANELYYNMNRPFVQFINNYGFELHINDYLKYVRSNRTTTIFTELNNQYELIIKGAYKYLPPELININKNILADENIDQEYLNKIYSREYYDIIRHNGLNDLLQLYYVCGGDKILNAEKKYEKLKRYNQVDPRLYLQTFIYPVLLSEKLD